MSNTIIIGGELTTGITGKDLTTFPETAAGFNLVTADVTLKTNPDQRYVRKDSPSKNAGKRGPQRRELRRTAEPVLRLHVIRHINRLQA